MFEDAYNGLKAGIASGIYTIGLATGHTVEEIKPLCNYALSSFKGMTFEKIMKIINSANA